MCCPTKWHVAVASVAYVAMFATEVAYDGYRVKDHKHECIVLTVCKSFNYTSTFFNICECNFLKINSKYVEKNDNKKI